MKKEKYLQIFNYLKEFSKLRSNPVRDIDAQETQYPEKFWLSDIPENELFENIIRPEFNSDNDYWLKVKKPKEPTKPVFSKLSDNLELWIERATLIEEEDEPKLKESIEVKGEIIESENFPELVEELQNYIEKKWIDDLIDYNVKIEAYNIEYAEYEKLNSVYKKLFRIFNKTQQFGEEYELVVGVGLLNFKENDARPKIFRHILTQRVDINFEYSQKDSQISITPNLESTPQIETDSILDLFDQFDSQNIIDAEKAVENYLKEKNIETVFDNTEDALQMFAERVSPDGSYKQILEKPKKTNPKPVISFSPALLLRKRNTRSFTALYDNILGNIESGETDIEIPTINDLIGINPESDSDFGNGESANNYAQVEPIFFPKEYNDEQIEIIEKAKRNNKVLVQGPPGTGKSHTIANLICHLLANGKKVLITAYTKRALEVLKDKLPPEFQDLAVNLLSGDSSSVHDLQSSVNAINDELSRANLSDYQNDIEKFQENLKTVRESIAENKNKLLNIKEKATRKQEINKDYKGTLTEIAENLESDTANFEWYEDNFYDIENARIGNDLENIIQFHQEYKNVDIDEFDYLIPELQRLPSIEQIQEYSKLTQKLKTEFGIDENFEKVISQDFDELIQQLKELRALYNSIDNIQIDFTNLVIDGNLKLWNQKTEESESVITRIEKHEIRNIDKDIEIAYPTNKSLKQLKKDAQTLVAHLKEGNPLSGFSFAIKKSFFSKEIKERLYFIEAVRVNGSACDTIEEFNIVLRDIGFQQDFNELSEIWNKKVPEGNSISNKLIFFKNIYSEVLKLIKLIEKIGFYKNQIENESTLKIKPYDKSDLKLKIRQTEFIQLSNQINAVQELIDESISYLKQENFHPVKETIYDAFNRVDSQIYIEGISEVEQLRLAKSNFQSFLKLKLEVNNHLPFIVATVENDTFSKQDLPKLKPAVFFLHAKTQLGKLMDIDYEDQLIRSLNELEKRERKLIAKLASKKAWYKVIEGLQQNRSLRQHLDAWVMAVKKIGKTGKGKRAMKFRKIAQQEMQHCKDSVPCWIMPLYKVAETIQPEQEMYDYVIIDEASQLGPDAIFLLYIAKNIIIVGDDKQTSPEYVGVNANTMTPHIKRHLKGIPRNDFYGTEFSFFDHAKFFCDGVTVLREHFRCMPEIIEFSNRHFYAPDGKGLYPLKQYSEKRLEPLVSIFCSNGYIEGRYSAIINEPEANEIAETIGRLIDDDRYVGKTFGVITLQGSKQSNLIENLLLKKIGEKEFHKRKIVCGNSASFQGDERDVIFLSLVTAHNHNRSALVKPTDERRFNVAMSRAIEQVWLFHSVQLDDLSNTNDLRYKLLDHIKNYKTPEFKKRQRISVPRIKTLGTQPEPFDSWFEVDVFNDIIDKGLMVIPQYEVAKGRYRIDLVMLLPNGTKIAIECDGDKWHGPEQYENDMMREKVLQRCGWQFFRVRGSEYYVNRTKALQPLWEIIPQVEEPKEPVPNNENLSLENKIENKYTEIEKTISEPSSYNLIIDEPKIIEEPSEQTTSNSNGSDILRYFNLYNSGTYILTENESLEADYVIPLKANHCSGFLMQCYSSGHINKVHISVLLSKRVGKEYMNGINRNGDLSFLKVIESEKIVGIYFSENGRKKFKAHLTENISSREQLHLQGYKVIYSDFEKIKFEFLPLEIKNDISRLIYQSFTANGKPMDNNYYETEWQALNRVGSKQTNNATLLEQAPVASLFENIPNSLFDVKEVELNSTVKIKYLNKDKVLTIKLVDYQTQGMDMKNGVQKINVKTPLGTSIKGKTVGDRVKIGNTDSLVEIIEIN
jgi:superfamily I DNA and/or RNA helicase/transcription elongation GreA/GreB family factor/very-short-patch-repair endonuclease